MDNIELCYILTHPYRHAHMQTHIRMHAMHTQTHTQMRMHCIHTHTHTVWMHTKTARTHTHTHCVRIQRRSIACLISLGMFFLLASFSHCAWIPSHCLLPGRCTGPDVNTLTLLEWACMCFYSTVQYGLIPIVPGFYVPQFALRQGNIGPHLAKSGNLDLFKKGGPLFPCHSTKWGT